MEHKDSAYYNQTLCAFYKTYQTHKNVQNTNSKKTYQNNNNDTYKLCVNSSKNDYVYLIIPFYKKKN